MRFGELLTKHREKAGYTSTELAKKMGVSLTYIRNLELRGKKSPPFERCIQLTEILNLSKKETKIFLETAFEERLNEKDKEFYKAIKIENK